MAAKINGKDPSLVVLIKHHCPLISTSQNGTSSQEKRQQLGISNKGNLKQGIGCSGIGRLKGAKEKDKLTQRLGNTGSSYHP